MYTITITIWWNAVIQAEIEKLLSTRSSFSNSAKEFCSLNKTVVTNSL